MGFDNECIVNIQSLAGEYFCPVCRLLVFPDEALQTQCTHLYCKPCLTYTVNTTRACPYDGYLVTEADSKPLRESNKALADTIGKIAVHCLYHRSGCTWQGILSDCTTHCSGCAYGNSPVVCNRCGIQIVHRQVQEHAQNCPGVQGQVQQAAIAQDPSATSAVASTDQNQAAQNQAAVPVGATASQSLTSQTAVTTTTPGQVSNQLTNTASQTQALVQSAVQPTVEQWYQQQQYQQYYQQYPRQDSYQQQYQHYYPYQQPVVPQYQQAYGHPQPQSQSQPQPHAPHQSQPQLQPQPQAQGLSQPLSQIQAPMAASSQNQTQVHQQPQQVQPVLQPHGQTNPPSHGQALPQPQPYPYTQVQPQPQQNMQMTHQQPLPQMQHSQSQIQQPVPRYPGPQSQVHPQVQSNAPVQHLSQPPVYPHQPMTPNVQPQVQNTTSHAVTGHHSYPQPPHPNMQPGVSQHTMHVHPHSGPQPQAQHPIQMQNQFPPHPVMRPNQSHAMFPNQQQPAVLPSPVSGQTTPPLQQQPVYTHNQQPGQINQRPMLQSIQQVPQQPFAPHQMATASPLRPQAPAHSFPKHAYPQLQGNTALSNSAQHSQSQNAGGRPLAPNHTGHTQQFVQSTNTNSVRPGQTGAGYPPENHNLLVGTNNQAQLPSELQSRASEPIERQGDVHVSASANEVKSEKTETNLKQIEVGNKQNSEDLQSMKTSVPNTNALENGNSVNKNLGMSKAVESNMKPSSGNKSSSAVPSPPGVLNNSNEHSVRGNEFQDGLPTKTETKLPEPQTDKLNSDDTCAPIHPIGAGNPAPSVSQGNGSFAQPSHSGIFTDQSKHQQLMINYGPAPVQNRSSATPASRSPHPAIPNQPLSEVHSSTLVRNHGLAHAPGQGFQPQTVGGNPGPYNQIHETPFHAGASNMSHIGGPQFGAPLHGDMHGRMTANLPHHAPEGFGLHDERFKPFHAPNQKNIDRREFDDDLKKFPRLPLDAEPVSRFGNYSLGLHESGKRPVDFYDDVIKKSGSTLHPAYLGPGLGYGRHHMDGMAPRSPVSEYTEMSSQRLGTHSGGKPGIDDFDGRVARRYAEFHDSRFSHLPSHLHREEFDNFGNFRMGEHPRSGEFIGQDEFAGHFRRGDHLVPHNFPRHLQLGEPVGFGAHPGHMRAVEFSGSRSIESFSKGNRPGHPQLGEPGFRSSFSLSGLPNDAGISTGDIRSFDNSRRRKAYSMGWCRICKVDCETVEGLDLHSQTREHQRMAMDIVKAIKQNAKKLKL